MNCQTFLLRPRANFCYFSTGDTIPSFLWITSTTRSSQNHHTRGRTGHPPAGSRSQSLARPKFPSRANTILAGMLARGVDIIARDYVKVTRSVTRRREPARARSDKAGLIGSRCESRDRLAHDPFHTQRAWRGSWHTRRSLARSALGRGRLPPELGAGDIQAQASRPPGWAGVLNPDAESPRTGIVDRDSGPRRLLPMEAAEHAAEGHAACR